MLTLIGRRTVKEVPALPGKTLLDHALKHRVDWSFSCSKGTCGRCRCLIEEGMDGLSLPSDKELDRLEPEEIQGGYRLGCQAVVRSTVQVKAAHKPYF